MVMLLGFQRILCVRHESRVVRSDISRAGFAGGATRTAFAAAICELSTSRTRARFILLCLLIRWKRAVSPHILDICVLQSSLIREPFSRRSGGWVLPSKKEKVVTAQGAPVRQKYPVDGSLHEIPDTHSSEIDRAAMRTARGEHSLRASMGESEIVAHDSGRRALNDRLESEGRVTSGFDRAGRRPSSDGPR